MNCTLLNNIKKKKIVGYKHNLWCNFYYVILLKQECPNESAVYKKLFVGRHHLYSVKLQINMNIKQHQLNTKKKKKTRRKIILKQNSMDCDIMAHNKIIFYLKMMTLAKLPNIYMSVYTTYIKLYYSNGKGFTRHHKLCKQQKKRTISTLPNKMKMMMTMNKEAH